MIVDSGKWTRRANAMRLGCGHAQILSGDFHSDFDEFRKHIHECGHNFAKFLDNTKLTVLYKAYKEDHNDSITRSHRYYPAYDATLEYHLLLWTHSQSHDSREMCGTGR